MKRTVGTQSFHSFHSCAVQVRRGAPLKRNRASKTEGESDGNMLLGNKLVIFVSVLAKLGYFCLVKT